MYRSILAFLLLFLSPLFAFAQTPIENTKDSVALSLKACEGNNLLSTLSLQDKKALNTKTASVKNGKGVFWKIEKDGIAPSWLLGTIHATDERVLNLKTPIKQHLEQAHRVVLELAEVQDKASMMRATSEVMLKHQNLMNFENGKTFKQEIPKEFQEDIDAVLKNHDLTADQLLAMKPWLVYSAIAYPKCESLRLQNGFLVLDEELAESAKRNLIPVHGLESVEEQALAFATIPDAIQFEFIAKSAKTDQSDRDIFETMIDTYLSEDIATILKLNGVFKEYEVSKKSEDIFNEALLTKRNHRMVDRMIPMIELGNSFFAVGAAHLPDEEGLIELLRNKGYKVTRVVLTQ